MPTLQPSFVPPPVPARPRSRSGLVGDALRRPGGRRAVSLLSLVLFLAGVGLFSFPLGTDLYSRYQQDQLAGAFEDPAVRESYVNRTIQVGDGLTRLKVEELGVDVLVVEGTTPSALRAGAGHYVGTPLPGEAGNVGIAGHRTTYGRPFNRLDELEPGDTVVLETPLAVHTYRAVEPFDGHGNPWVVTPQAVEVIAPVEGGSFLTLTTCHPKGSARQRLVMRFELVSTEPVPPPAAPA